MRNIRIAAISVLGTAALLAPAGTAFAATTKPECETTSAAVLKANAANEKTVEKLIHSTHYTPIMRTFEPKPTSTRDVTTGYETITVKSPKGTSPVAGYFTRSGSQACSIVVTSAQVDLKQNAYVLKLKFPGENGTPGKFTVATISR